MGLYFGYIPSTLIDFCSPQLFLSSLLYEVWLKFLGGCTPHWTTVGPSKISGKGINLRVWARDREVLDAGVFGELWVGDFFIIPMYSLELFSAFDLILKLYHAINMWKGDWCHWLVWDVLTRSHVLLLAYVEPIKLKKAARWGVIA